MVHIAESTVGRRYAGWFIKNTERAQKIFEDLRHTPLPAPPANKNSITSGVNSGTTAGAASASVPGGAKEAADAILVDDNFSTILPAVEEGELLCCVCMCLWVGRLINLLHNREIDFS